MNAAAALTLGTDRLDLGFGTNGTATTNFNRGGILVESSPAMATSVVVQSNGKIVVAGTVSESGGNQNFAVVRYQRNGSLDRSFGDRGKVVIGFDLGGSDADVVSGLALQSDGRIVMVGTASVDDSGNRDFAVTRLLSNGRLDTSFDGDGKTTVAFDLGGDEQDVAGGVAIQSDGKIVVVGTSQVNDSVNTDMAIVRLLASGALDATFDADGKQTVAMQPDRELPDVAAAVAIDGSSRIVVAGSTQPTSGIAGHDFAVVRLTPAGALDTKFDRDGRATVAFNLGGSQDDRGTAVRIQGNGRIVIGGYAQVTGDGNDDFAVARLNSNGSLDRTFDGDGRVTVAFDAGGSSRDRLANLALQANGRIMLVGSAPMNSSGDHDFAVARLNHNGTRDSNFNGDGRATIPFDRGGSNGDFASGIAIQSDRRVLITGRAATATAGDFDFALTRLLGLG